MELTVLMTSDIHGHIYPTNFTERRYEEDYGLARVASVLLSERKKAQENLVVIENGDLIQGSPLATYLATQKKNVEPISQLANALHPDAGVLGNHEFNHGLNYLASALEAANYPVLAANITDESGAPLTGQGYQIIERSGLKIAILGLTTQYIPHWEMAENISGLHFASAVATAKEWVPRLRELADLVIVSYHGGFERDLETGEPTEALTGENEGYELATEVAGIDALVTGHQHRTLATKIGQVPIVQPGYRGAFVGKILLEVEKVAGKWQVVASKPELIATADYEPNPEILAQNADLQEEVESWLDEPLGTVQGDMLIHNPDLARLEEHPYIEFIQKVQLWASGADISGTALFNNEGKGFAKNITMRDVVTNYIYPNTLAVLRLSGADLRAAIEQSVGFFCLNAQQELSINPRYIEPKPQYYNYDMYEGVAYTVDMTRPEGNRLTTLTYQGKPLADTAEIEVVMNQYRAVGGGDFTMFSADKIVREIQVEMAELIRQYLVEHPVIVAEANHNFRFSGYQGVNF